MRKVVDRIISFFLAFVIVATCIDLNLFDFGTVEVSAEASYTTVTTLNGTNAYYDPNADSQTQDTYYFSYHIGDTSVYGKNGEGNWKTSNSNTATLTKFVIFNNAGTVNIPKTVLLKYNTREKDKKGNDIIRTFALKVTAVGDGTNPICSYISGTLKMDNDNVTQVNSYAFKNCTIGTLSVEKAITYSNRAFYGATITNANFKVPSTYGATTFENTTITNLKLVKDIPNHNGAFSGKNGIKVTNLDVDCTHIYDEMFAYSPTLTLVDMTNGNLDYVGTKAFFKCPKLAGANGRGNTDIKSNNWSSIKLNSGIKGVGKDAFDVLGQTRDENQTLQEVFQQTQAGISQEAYWASDADRAAGIATIKYSGWMKDGLAISKQTSSPIDFIIGMDTTYSQNAKVDVPDEINFAPCFKPQEAGEVMNNNSKYCVSLPFNKKETKKHTQFDINKKTVFDCICDLKRQSPKSRVGLTITCSNATLAVMDVNTTLDQVTWPELEQLYYAIQPDVNAKNFDSILMKNGRMATSHHGDPTGASDYYAMSQVMFKLALSRSYQQYTYTLAIGDFECNGASFASATAGFLSIKSLSDESYAINVLGDNDNYNSYTTGSSGKNDPGKLTYAAGSRAFFAGGKNNASAQMDFYHQFKEAFTEIYSKIALKVGGIEAKSDIGDKYSYNSTVAGSPTNYNTYVLQYNVPYNEIMTHIYTYKVKIKDSTLDGNFAVTTGGSLSYKVYDKNNALKATNTKAFADAKNLYYDTWTLKYNGNGCTSGSMDPTYRHWSQTATVKANTFYKKGYTFTNWLINNVAYNAGNVWMSSSSNPNAGTSTNKVSTAYAQWRPNEYDIYYDKGLTDDASTVTIEGATRNTNLQSTGKNRPYTHAVYDKDVTFATAKNLKGRHYILNYDPNLPELSGYTNKQGGAATDAVKATYKLTLKGNSDSLQTIRSVNPNDSNKVARMEGTLPFSGKWQIVGADSDSPGKKLVNCGETVTKPNYKDADKASCDAVAYWETMNISSWAYPEPTMDGYVFLGWYDKPEYEIVPDGKGGFTHDAKGSRLVTNIDDYIKIQPATTTWNKTVYAHWMPVMAYLNYSADDDAKGRDNYLTRKNAHLVNSGEKSGYLTKDVHVGTRYWEYKGNSASSSFFMPYADLTNYVRYNELPNPALYFDVELYPRTLLGTKTSVDSTAASDEFRVFMPQTFLNTVFEFKQENGGVGNSQTLLNANLAQATWSRATGTGVTYDGEVNRQAKNAKYKYTIYDVWTLKGWYLSNSAESIPLDTLITEDTKINNDKKSDKYSFDLAAVWNIRPTDMTMPLPKRILAFELDSENGIFYYESNPENQNYILKNIDIDAKQTTLRPLAEGKQITDNDNTYYDKDANESASTYKPIVSDASNCLIYDFGFDGWEDATGSNTSLVGQAINTNKHTKYYAKWNNNPDITLPQVKKEGYVFLGWFTVPQNIIAASNTHNISDLSTPSDEQYKEYWAGAGYDFIDGELVAKNCLLQKNCKSISWDIASNHQTLYAWFNREPVFVDLYEGLFFEGQDVSLSELKKLVGVFDFEDDYSALALQYIESLPEVDMDQLYLPVIVDKDASFEVHKDYTESEILETIQIENYEFDSDHWKPYTSEYWQDLAEQGKWEEIEELKDVPYDELPNEDEEEGSGKYTPMDRDITIKDGKLYTPRHPEGIDGVYQQIAGDHVGEVYYTAEAKAELAYYIQNLTYKDSSTGEEIDNSQEWKEQDYSESNAAYMKKTGLLLKVKSITYKVDNETDTTELCEIDVPYNKNVKSSYDKTITKYTKIQERSRYTNAPFVDRNKKPVYRPISEWRLDTSSDRIKTYYDEEEKEWTGEGYFDVTYEVTDNGIMFNGVILAHSPITIRYTRECKIQYNKLPQIAITNIVDFIGSNYDSYDEFEDTLLRAQTVIDGEDNVTNLPWWTKKKTTPKLVNSIEIDKVKGFTFDYALLDRYGLLNEDGSVKPSVALMEDEAYTIPLKELYNNYKCNTDKTSENYKLWHCMTSFKIVVDAHDQWGKYASGKVVPNWHKKSDGGDGGPKVGDDGEGVWVKEVTEDDPKPKQPEEYRTITVILINEDDDLSMNAANIMETVRFINERYLTTAKDSLGDTYWGTTGSAELEAILNKHNTNSGKGNSDTPSDNYTNRLGNTVDIYVEDYTN